jgi:thiol-disulfide isomerase/thioredoxin
VLWFWAPWCATCFGQAALVSAEAQEFTGRVNFVGVAGLGGAKEMAEFVSDGEVGNVTHLNDQAGAVWRKFGITEQSQFVLLDRAGKVVQKGFLDSVTFDQWVRHIAK